MAARVEGSLVRQTGGVEGGPHHVPLLLRGFLFVEGRRSPLGYLETREATRGGASKVDEEVLMVAFRREF